MMFSQKSMEARLGKEVKCRDSLFALQEVERYLLKKIEHVPVEASHDCTANEKSFYKTLNYTSYAGLFMMSPLSYAPSVFQMFDAKCDAMEDNGHLQWIMGNMKADMQCKYVIIDDSEFKQEPRSFTHLAVLPGGNKFRQHVSKRKLDAIISKHGSDLAIKPHPISKGNVLEELNVDTRDSIVCSPKEHLYFLMAKAEEIYTTHISETALTSLIMGKKISPLDPYHNRLVGSYSHINHFCFSEPEPLKVIGSIFASPKSGIIHPDVDENWQSKIDQYLDYTLSMRRLQKDHYLE